MDGESIVGSSQLPSSSVSETSVRDEERQRVDVAG